MSRDMTDLHLDCHPCWEGSCVTHMPVYPAVQGLVKDYEALSERYTRLKEQNDRIKAALELATWGQEDGAHHKAWAVDQMVRALTGCPMVAKTAVDAHGRTYTYETQGESDEYLAWVKAYEGNDDDVDPEDRIHWDTGIAP